MLSPGRQHLDAVSSYGFNNSGNISVNELNEFKKGLSKTVKGQSTCPMSRGCGTWASSAWKRGGFGVST